MLVMAVLLKYNGYQFGKIQIIVSVILILFFIYFIIINILKIIKTKEINVRLFLELTISVIAMFYVFNFIDTGIELSKKTQNTIIYYKGSMCFNFDSNCTVNMNDEVASYVCKNGISGTMKVQKGRLDTTWSELTMLKPIKARYHKSSSDSMKIHYELSVDKILYIDLFKNNNQIGVAPLSSCKLLENKNTKIYTVYY